MTSWQGPSEDPRWVNDLTTHRAEGAAPPWTDGRSASWGEGPAPPGAQGPAPPESASPESAPAEPVPARPLRPPDDVADVIRCVNESSEAIEDQYLRARHMADQADRVEQSAVAAADAAKAAKVACRVVQAEWPRRRAPLPRQVALALVTVGLDGLACYFAAQALDGSQDATLVWAALFLAVLAGGEVALDFYRDRNPSVWRGLVGLLGVFVAGLGILRFSYLATVGYGGLVPAAAGAFLFTAATGGFIFLGYRALRASETPQAWRARRRARGAARKAETARAAADRDAAARDRLIDAYLKEVRRHVLKTCLAGEQLAMESAVREHLLGRVRAPA